MTTDIHMAMHLVKVLGKRVEQLEGDLIYRLEGLPLPEPDYEALGYQETLVAQCFDLEAVGEVVDDTMTMLRENLSWGRLPIRNNETL